MVHSTADHCYIAGDWGTSHLRLFLINAATGEPIAEKQGPGIGVIGSAIDSSVDSIMDNTIDQTMAKQDIPGLLANLTADWREQYAPRSAFLCGMVGSNIGWVDTGYVECPLSPNVLSRHLVHLSTDCYPVILIPGVKCQSPTGAPDVMRGEETQILGALASDPELGEGSRLICLPGTHSKWVLLEQGSIRHFITSLAGELFSLLNQHSVLTTGDESEAFSQGSAVSQGPAFSEGVKRSLTCPATDLLHLLFETRSRQLEAGLSSSDAASFLSGLIIGRDINSALSLFGDTDLAVTFIGQQVLTGLYLTAAEILGAGSSALDGDTLSRAGIHTLYLTKH